ncbi:MAG: lyase family protein, partial [Actinomycetota bacterium]|nr:lyase family protein [Actinomycetota bacterium]
MDNKYRIEKDSMGEFKVPEEANYGASTARAVENFPISNLKFTRTFIRALGEIKKAAALVNLDNELLSQEMTQAIVEASEEVISGKYDKDFVIDIFQTGSGTSTNMNANEVIAKVAMSNSGQSIHPNDHVNMSQSSNDVIPTATNVAAVLEANEKLIPNIDKLIKSLESKGLAWRDVYKNGKTHLMDATPVTLGQEFSGYAALL